MEAISLLEDAETSWTPTVETGPNKGQPRCQAKSKQTGKQCRRQAADGREVCFIHGGATPRGPILPQYKHGRSSKYLPPGPIADAYAEMHRDRAQLMDLSDDIAVIDGFRADALAALSGADLATLADTIDSISKALVRDVNPITPQEAADRLSQAAQNANDAAQAKRRATSASHDKAKLIQVELQRRAQMDKLLTKEQAIAYGTAIVDACKSKLSDDDHQWLANEAQRAAVRILLGADPDQQ